MVGIAAGSPSATASAALVGSASRYPAIPRKLFARHQCARTIGHVSGGILLTSPTSLEITDSPRPLLTFAINLGTSRPPVINSASDARPTPGRASQAPRCASFTPSPSIFACAGETLNHSLGDNGS